MTRTLLMSVALCLMAASALRADALGDLKHYEYGQDQTSLLAAERQTEASMADRARQAEMAARLLEVMTDPGATLAGKQHAAILLRLCGTEAEVPALAKMLGQGPVGEFARGSLERIPGPVAAKALRDALQRLQGPALVAVIHSVANRHDREAVSPLTALTEADDPKVAAALSSGSSPWPTIRGRWWRNGSTATIRPRAGSRATTSTGSRPSGSWP